MPPYNSLGINLSLTTIIKCRASQWWGPLSAQPRSGLSVSSGLMVLFLVRDIFIFIFMMTFWPFCEQFYFNVLNCTSIIPDSIPAVASETCPGGFGGLQAGCLPTNWLRFTTTTWSTHTPSNEPYLVMNTASPWWNKLKFSITQITIVVMGACPSLNWSVAPMTTLSLVGGFLFVF